MVRMITIPANERNGKTCVKCGSTQSVKYKVTSSVFGSEYFCCNKCCFDVKDAIEKTELDHLRLEGTLK